MQYILNSIQTASKYLGYAILVRNIYFYLMNQSQKPTACYTTLKLTPQLSRLDLIYNPSKLRGDISNITQIRSFSVK